MVDELLIKLENMKQDLKKDGYIQEVHVLNDTIKYIKDQDANSTKMFKYAFDVS